MSALTTGPVPPTSVKYFYGRISRDEAESVLSSRGCEEGLYLLRESMTVANNYALSICHNGKVHHYSIERQPDKRVMIQDGKPFAGPVELIQHHEMVLDGFLTRPTKPCERLPDQAPMAWPGVTMLDLEKLLIDKADSMNLKGEQLENALGPKRQQFIQIVAKDLHKEQPWFHGRISRDGADIIMNNDGHLDGKFLVRERDDKTYALSLSYRNQTKHYKIEKHKSSTSGEKLAIEDGPRFDSLMEMISHYHNKIDGLLCKLTGPCVRPGHKAKAKGPMPMQSSRIYGLNSPEDIPLPSVREDSSRGMHPLSRLPPRISPQQDLVKKWNDPMVRTQGIISNEHVQNSIWDDPDLDGESPEKPPPIVPTVPPRIKDDDPQKIYDSVPRTEEVFNLNKNDLELSDRLGAGNFGSVMRGWYRRKGQAIPVAIKTLKQDDIRNAEVDLLKEARVMAGLQYRHIVRLIGVCRSDNVMLVMELAPLGQLNKYLKRHFDVPVKTVLDLMFQVAEGMQYLESKNFVHRDLAARNVLLVNDRFAKISDFGMSKALGLGSNYYQAETAGKWPLKWYAPECIYYFRFDSKSDVWSFGVTLWEALSYGAKPYKGLKGQQILELIEFGGRLDKPDSCSPGVYEVMLQCWNYTKEHRPSFKELVELLRKYK